MKIGETWKNKKDNNKIVIVGINWVSEFHEDLINYKYIDPISGYGEEVTSQFIKKFERVYENR